MFQQEERSRAKVTDALSMCTYLGCYPHCFDSLLSFIRLEKRSHYATALASLVYTEFPSRGKVKIQRAEKRPMVKSESLKIETRSGLYVN